MDMIFSNRDASAELNNSMDALAALEANYVCEPMDYADLIAEHIKSGGAQSGDSLPWAKADDIQKLRPGELSIWAGINGHGKSQLLGQVIAWRLKTRKALIASLEMKPHQTLYRMICQHAGCKASPEYSNRVLRAMTGRLWVYDQLDTVQSSRIFALIHYAATELGVNDIVIDSLMKCGLGSGDYDKEKRFIDRLQWMAKTFGVHIHLVAHARKGNSENDMLDKFDIKGDSSLTDIPDNVFIVQRNKRREAALRKQEKFPGCGLLPDEQKALEQPDAWLRVAKNRHGGEEGLIGLYFHRASGQYVPRDDYRVLPSPFEV